MEPSDVVQESFSCSKTYIFEYDKRRKKTSMAHKRIERVRAFFVFCVCV